MYVMRTEVAAELRALDAPRPDSATHPATRAGAGLGRPEPLGSRERRRTYGVGLIRAAD